MQVEEKEPNKEEKANQEEKGDGIDFEKVCLLIKKEGLVGVRRKCKEKSEKKKVTQNYKQPRVSIKM